MSVNTVTRNSLRESDLFVEPDLAGAELREAHLARANLSRAELSEANLARANLTGANLSEANLSRADLTEASLAEHTGRVGTGNRRREHPTTCRPQPPGALGRED
jgi:uncharacterized protein YjbI with pentapeptide repeats